MPTTSTESVRPEVIDAAEALAHLTTNEAEVQEALDAIARIRPRVLTGITAADVQTELRWLIDMLAPDWLTPLLPQVLPSLVEHGRTGFLAAAEDDLVEHLRDLDSIDPQTCRDAAEQWTPAGMARRYLDLYHRLLEENPT